jgi:type II secretory pathway pseudopilin PulG
MSEPSLQRPLAITLIGIVDLLAASLAGTVSLGLLIAGLIALARHEGPGAALLVGGVALGLVFLLCLAAGIGMLRLAPWGRALQFVASGLGLFAVCLGTIVNAVILVYLLQPSARVALSGKRPDQLTEDERKHLAGAPSGSTVLVAVVVLVVLVLGGIAATGIVAAIAVPNFVTAVERGKQKRTMADVKSIAAATEAYAVDYNTYPHASSMDDLAAVLAPTYAKILPMRDGWDRPFDVGTKSESYVIRSRGKDGVPDEEDPWALVADPHEITDFQDDIAYSNGTFVRWPQDPLE